jgi:hypothetical protein
MQSRFPAALMESYPPDYVRALVSSSLDMFKALLLLEQERNDNHYRLERGLLQVCVASRIEIVQYFLEQGKLFWSYEFSSGSMARAMDPNNNPLNLAMLHGHRALINLYIQSGGKIFTHHLAVAMENPWSLSPIYLMIQHLIDAGASVDEDILKRCEGRASYIQKAIYKRKTVYNCLTNSTMTVILIAHEASKHLSPDHLQKCSSVRLLLRYFINGKIKVPFAPKPFLEMAHEIMEIIKGVRVGQ